MKSKKTFMLDMDGVCCDWVTPALKAIGKEEYINNWKLGERNLENTGMSYTEIWKVIDLIGSDWWRNLDEYPWFWDLYNTLKENGDVVFCTSPSWDSNCLKGKVEWLQDRFGRGFRDYIFTNRKFYTANSNTVLVDDNDKQCHNFRKKGGRTILFPQPWNDLAFDEQAQLDRMKYVKGRINEIVNRKLVHYRTDMFKNIWRKITRKCTNSSIL